MIVFPLSHIELYEVISPSRRQRTGGPTSSVTESSYDSTILKARLFYFQALFIQSYFCPIVIYYYCVHTPSTDTEIKGEILFLGNYESEFDWSNETAKVKQTR